MKKIIEVTGLKKNFLQGNESVAILKGVNFTLHEGETVALLGQSGSGKSTLLSLIAGLDSPTSGEIKLDGQSVSSLNEDEWADLRSQKVGLVFQQFYLLNHLTALENVLLPLEMKNDSARIEKAESLLKEVGLGHRLNHKPSQLSGGECQRVALARGLVGNPMLLLADEPSGSLDTQTAKKVMELFFKLVKQHRVTTLLVTHDRELAAQCDRTLELKAGVM